MNSLKDQLYWKSFVKKENLTQAQQDQMIRYIQLLLDYNKHTNVTAITDLSEIVAYHLQDSLMLGRYVNLADKHIADVGSGGGFPGIPLKIKYPTARVVLIEVNQKKITFLESVIEQLGLQDIEVCALDWRMFIRHTDADIDIFCARASLQPDELVRIFSADNHYRTATVVYWAAQRWDVDKKVQPFVYHDLLYTVGLKKRRLVFFGADAAHQVPLIKG